MAEQKTAVTVELFELPKDLAQRAENVLALAEGFEVDSVETRDMAIDMAQQSRGVEREILKIIDPFVSDDHAKWKRSVKRRNDTIKPYDGIAKILTGKADVWEQEQQRIEREAREKAEAEARAQAAREQEREAKKLQRSGDVKGAAQVRNAPVSYVTPVTPERPKARGLVGRTLYKAKITNFEALLKSAAAKQDHRCYIIADMSQLDRVGQATKGKAVIPGVEFVEERSSHTRA